LFHQQLQLTEPVSHNQSNFLCDSAASSSELLHLSKTAASNEKTHLKSICLFARGSFSNRITHQQNLISRFDLEKVAKGKLFCLTQVMHKSMVFVRHDVDVFIAQ